MSQTETIDGLQFARAASEQQGEFEVKYLSRLTEAGCLAGRLRYRVCGTTNDHRNPCLQISVAGSVKLTCQRCLEEIDFTVSIETELELSEDFGKIAEADDETDRVLADRAMPVGQLVEDEVILALPMVAIHDNCVASVAADPTKTGRTSPFGALDALKRGL